MGWKISGTDSRGYSQIATVSFAEPTKADPTATESVYRNGKYVAEKKIKACPVNASTDAVVEVSVTLQNTTSNFPENLGLVLSQGNSLTGSLQVASDEYYSTGPSCTTPSTGNSNKVYGLVFPDKTQPNATASTTFLLILHNYYTPTNPSGDVPAYKAIRLDPQLTFGPDSDTRYVRNPTLTYNGTAAIPTPQFFSTTSTGPSSTTSTAPITDWSTEQVKLELLRYGGFSKPLSASQPANCAVAAFSTLAIKNQGAGVEHVIVGMFQNQADAKHELDRLNGIGPACPDGWEKGLNEGTRGYTGEGAKDNFHLFYRSANVLVYVSGEKTDVPSSGIGGMVHSLKARFRPSECGSAPSPSCS